MALAARQIKPGRRSAPARPGPVRGVEDPTSRRRASREAALDLAYFVRHQISASGPLHLVGKNDFRRPGGMLRRSGANLGRRLGLGERDLGFSLLGAPRDELLQPLGGLNIQLLGLSARLGDNGSGVGFGFSRLFLEARQ